MMKPYYVPLSSVPGVAVLVSIFNSLQLHGETLQIVKRQWFQGACVHNM